MSTAGKVDLQIDQGADFAVQIYWTDSQSNPFTVLSPMRMDIKSETGEILYTLQTDDEAPDDVEDSILYNATSGLIQLTLSAKVTNNFPSGRYAYDLFTTYQDNAVTKETRTRKLITGNVYVLGRVTQSD